MKNKNFVFALTILISTIIGAGIFGIPYVVSKSGVLPSFFYFLVLGGATLLVHLFFGEIVLRNEGKHRIIGYAQKYFGSRGKLLITISTIAGLLGTLLAYGILAGDFLKIIFSSVLSSAGPSSFALTLAFFSILSFFIFRGMKTIAPIEIFTNVSFFLIILTVFVIGLPKIDFNNFFLMNGGKNFFLPYGVIMFSLIGWAAIPEIRDILKSREEKRSLKKIIVFSAAFCLLLYMFFSFAVFGISGKNTTADSLSGLVPFLGPKIIFFGALAAVLTLIDSFLLIGLSLRNTLIYDLKFSKILAPVITCGFPIILFLAGFQNFIGTIGFMGTILGTINGIMIVLMYRKAKKIYDREPEYSLKVPSFLIYVLVLVFILGAIAQGLYYF
ncbi:MAG: aromatic amino acid transport family protein [Parcubacteria group bacterium]